MTFRIHQAALTFAIPSAAELFGMNPVLRTSP